MYQGFMESQHHEVMKSGKKTRPPQTGEPVLVRLQPDQMAALDNWRRGQEDLPSRAEAIRRILAEAEAAKKGKKR
jgi:hypothetical protein